MSVLSVWVVFHDPSIKYTHRARPSQAREKKLEELLDTRLSWGVEQRLQFIEFRLFWDGVLNRSDMTERFGVSVPQASNDLTMYRELAPGNLEYDASAKRYVSTPEFKPRFLKPNPDRYLAQLKAVSDAVIDIAGHVDLEAAV